MRYFRLLPRNNVNSILLGYYVASGGNFVQTFRDNTQKLRYEISTTLCILTYKNAVHNIFSVQLILLG